VKVLFRWRNLLLALVFLELCAECDAWLSIRCVEAGGKFEKVSWRDLCVARAESGKAGSR
jgi:hypothetical protein